MATKWKNYNTGFRMLAIFLVIVSAVSSMLTGYYTVRNHLLYDTENSAAYYNTVFFESCIQNEIDVISHYAETQNKQAVAQRDAENKALSEEYKNTLLALSDLLMSLYQNKFQASTDIFSGATDASDHFYRFLRITNDDEIDEEYYYNYVNLQSLPQIDRIYDIRENYRISVDDRVVESYDDNAIDMAQTVMNPTVATVNTIDPQPTTEQAAETETAYEIATVTTAPFNDIYAYYNDEADYYESSREAIENAAWLANVFNLRCCLISSVNTVYRSAIELMDITVGRDTYLDYSSLAENSLVQYLFYSPAYDEYFTNIEALQPESPGETMMQTGANIKDIIAQIRKNAENSPWHIFITADGIDHNIGNGTEGKSTLRNDFFTETKLKNYSSETIGGELYMFKNSGEYDEDIYAYIEQNFEDARDHADMLFLMTVAGVTVFLLSAAYILIAGTGRRIALDKLYNDWHFLLSGGLTAAAVVPAINIFSNTILEYARFGGHYHIIYYTVNNFDWSFAVWELLFPLLCAAALLVLFEYLVSVIRNARNGQLIRHSFWYALPAWGIRKARAHRGETPKHYRKMFTVTLIAGIVFIFIALICELSLFDAADVDAVAPFVLLLTILVFGGLLWLILYHIRGLDKITDAAEKIRKGDYTANLDFKKIPRHLRPLASDIMQNRDGIRTAVEQSIRDERMRTALITNVSHDLKTPLTSIVSYADLLKKCELEDKKAALYVDIINEKADKLKHLIEDLTEASKATTGNIKIEKIRINLYEMALQAVGEYSDELEKRRIETVISQPESDVIVYADNRQTWRIIENLLSNVKKYAMPGTRVYIDVRKRDKDGVFEIKNVSEHPLNIPAEELTQRFVRGDESRTTEGSGLGLSIAKSLCELQMGKFDIGIDGYLFKASVRLPLAYIPQPTEQPLANNG